TMSIVPWTTRLVDAISSSYFSASVRTISFFVSVAPTAPPRKATGALEQRTHWASRNCTRGQFFPVAWSGGGQFFLVDLSPLRDEVEHRVEAGLRGGYPLG